MSIKFVLGEAKPGGFQTGGFPLVSGKVQIVSRTLSGLFLIGALNRPRKGKKTNRENPRRVPEQIGKIPAKSGKSQKGQKGTKKDQSRSGNPPRLNPPPPRLAALDCLSIKSRFLPTPTQKSVNLKDFLLICTDFPLCAFRGGGVEPKFANKS